MRARIGFLLGLALCGCLSAESLTRRTVPAALDESVGFFEDPESQRRIERLMLDPQVQNAARELSKTLVDGVVESMTDDARQAELRRASTRYIEAVSAAAARSLRSDLGPAAAEAARHAVARVLDVGLSPETRQDMRALAQSLTQATVDGLMQAAGRGLRHDLGPALRAVIEDELGPGLRTVIARDLAPSLRRVLADELTPALALVAREVTHQIVIGGHDGLQELRFRERAGQFQVDFWNRLERPAPQGHPAQRDRGVGARRGGAGAGDPVRPGDLPAPPPRRGAPPQRTHAARGDAGAAAGQR
ncbi:hypothetical protein [Nannocystis pusilla]|uniref:hypothetical protein n=1 Tax=Nannocystis pusilla TaxID=889268 RepID=UPI003DA247AE